MRGIVRKLFSCEVEWDNVRDATWRPSCCTDTFLSKPHLGAIDFAAHES